MWSNRSKITRMSVRPVLQFEKKEIRWGTFLDISSIFSHVTLFFTAWYCFPYVVIIFDHVNIEFFPTLKVEGLNWKWKAPNFLILLSLTVTFDHEFGSDGRFYRARYFSCIWIWNPLIGFSIILLILNELQGRKHEYFILKSAYACMSSLSSGCDLMYDNNLVFTEILECLTISI